MSPKIEELLPLSETLNSESNELNKTITAINEKLAALNFGIAVSIKGRATWFGYAKVLTGPGKSSWELAYDADEWSVEVDEHGRMAASPTPLLKGSRDIRIEGLGLVPKIVARLKAEAEHRIRIMRDAKTLAAEL